MTLPGERSRQSFAILVGTCPGGWGYTDYPPELSQYEGNDNKIMRVLRTAVDCGVDDVRFYDGLDKVRSYLLYGEAKGKRVTADCRTFHAAYADRVVDLLSDCGANWDAEPDPAVCNEAVARWWSDTFWRFRDQGLLGDDRVFISWENEPNPGHYGDPGWPEERRAKWWAWLGAFMLARAKFVIEEQNMSVGLGDFSVGTPSAFHDWLYLKPVLEYAHEVNSAGTIRATINLHQYAPVYLFDGTKPNIGSYTGKDPVRFPQLTKYSYSIARHLQVYELCKAWGLHNVRWRIAEAGIDRGNSTVMGALLRRYGIEDQVIAWTNAAGAHSAMFGYDGYKGYVAEYVRDIAHFDELVARDPSLYSVTHYILGGAYYAPTADQWRDYEIASLLGNPGDWDYSSDYDPGLLLGHVRNWRYSTNWQVIPPDAEYTETWADWHQYNAHDPHSLLETAVEGGYNPEPAQELTRGQAADALRLSEWAKYILGTGNTYMPGKPLPDPPDEPSGCLPTVIANAIGRVKRK